MKSQWSLDHPRWNLRRFVRNQEVIFAWPDVSPLQLLSSLARVPTVINIYIIVANLIYAFDHTSQLYNQISRESFSLKSNLVLYPLIST